MLRSGFDGSFETGHCFSGGGDAAKRTDLAGAVADLLAVSLVPGFGSTGIAFSLKGEVVILG